MRVEPALRYQQGCIEELFRLFSPVLWHWPEDQVITHKQLKSGNCISLKTGAYLIFFTQRRKGKQGAKATRNLCAFA
jgi:hypothetical protein